MKSNLEIHSEILLASLHNTDRQLDIHDYLPIIKESTIRHHYDFYKKYHDFYKENKKYPDVSVLNTLQGSDFLDGGVQDLTQDFLMSFWQELTYDAKSERLRKALDNGDKEKIRTCAEDLTKKGLITREYKPTDAMKEYRKMLELPSGILTGTSLDDILKGLSYGTTTVIGAPPSNGKSTTAYSIAYNAAKSGFNGLLFSLEGAPRNVMFNLIARHAYEVGVPEITNQALIKCLIPEEQLDKVDEITSDLEGLKGKLKILTPADFDEITPQMYDAMIEKYNDLFEDKLDYVIFDYVQKIRGFMPQSSRDKWEDYCNKFVTHTAKRSVAFKGRGFINILLAQINRKGQLKMLKYNRADYDCLSELNSLERDADNIIVQSAPEAVRLSGQMLQQVIKNRSGEVMEELTPEYVDWAHPSVGSGDMKKDFTLESFSEFIDEVPEAMGSEEDELFI